MPSSVQGFLWTWPISALYGSRHSQRQSLFLLSQGQKHLRNPMCTGQTPKTYVKDEKWTWTSRQTNWSRLSCPYAAWCTTRTLCQEPSQTPESSPSGDTSAVFSMTDHAEPQCHLKEKYGMWVTYLLPSLRLLPWKRLRQELMGTVGRWHVGWGQYGDQATSTTRSIKSNLIRPIQELLYDSGLPSFLQVLIAK